MTSLIQLAQDKNAIGFKAALEERIQEKIDDVIGEEKVLVAGTLLGEAGVSGGVKKVWKKPSPGKHGASAPRPTLPEKGSVKESFSSDEFYTLDEKVISAGSIEHMAHAVHACHMGHCPAISCRGTFTHFEHPDYSIHRDNGSIDPDRHEMAYHVLGAGGHHKFSVENTKNGLDIKHVSHLG
jgi:hypothetical protein